MQNCEICKRRRAGFKEKVYISPRITIDMDLCGICSKKYKKLKDFYLAKAYQDMIEHYEKVNAKEDE